MKSGIAVLIVALACGLGATVGWVPADRYYTEWKYRTMRIPIDENGKKLPELIIPRMLVRIRESGVVGVAWGVGVCAALGIAGGIVRRSAAGVVAGLIGGAVIGAATGFAGGAAAQFVNKKIRYEKLLVVNPGWQQNVAVWLYVVSAFAIMSLGVALTYRLFAASPQTSILKAIAAGLIAALLSSMLYMGASSFFYFSEHVRFVPKGSALRLVWFLLPAVTMGFLIPIFSVSDATATSAQPVPDMPATTS